MLATIDIKQFGNLTDVRLAVKPLTYILGGNGQGKTMIRDAIEYALTGLARGLKVKKNMGLMGNNGSPKVTLYNQRGKLAATVGKGLDPELVRICLDPESFIRLPRKDRQRVILAHLIDTPQTIALPDYARNQPEFAPVAEALKHGNVEQADKIARDIRPGLKRLLAEQPQQPEPAEIPTTFEHGETTYNLADMVKKLPKLKERLQERMARRQELTSKYGPLKLADPDADAEELKKLEEELAFDKKASKQADADLSATLHEYEKHRDAVAKCDKHLAEQEGAKDLVQKFLEKLGRFGTGTCILSKDMPCAVTAEQAKAHKKIYLEQSSEITKRITDLETERQTLQAQEATWNSKAGDLEQETKQRNDRISLTTTRMETLKRALANYHGLDGATAEIDELDEKIRTINDLIAVVAAHQAAQREAQRAKAERSRLEDLVQKMEDLIQKAEWLCRDLDKDGVIRKEVLAKANDAPWDDLADMLGVQVRLESDGNILFNGRAIEFASGGERLVGALLIALRLFPKVGVLAIDEFERAEPNVRRAIAARAREWAKEGNVFVLWMLPSAPQITDGPATVARYWAQDGQYKNLT